MNELKVGETYLIQPLSVMIGNLILHQDEEIVVTEIDGKIVTIFRKKTNTTHKLSIYSILPII